MSAPRDRQAWQEACNLAESFRARVVQESLSGQGLTDALAETLYAQGETWRKGQEARDRKAAGHIARGVANALQSAIDGALAAYLRSVG